MMQIDIKHIARLARLKLDENQAEKFSVQMQNIIEMVTNLPLIEGDDNGLDESHPMRLRADNVLPSMKREDILKNAPQTSAGCIVVPRIME